MRFQLILTAMLGSGIAFAADPKPAHTPAMTVPARLLFSDDLTDGLDKTWTVAKGKYEAVEGATRGAELPADMHGAVARKTLAMDDVIIEYSFRLDGAKGTTLSLNDSKGHVCRVSVRPSGFLVQKDDHDGKKGPDKGIVLGKCDTPIKAGEWHTLTVEIRGPELLARLDGQQVAYGQHEQVDLAKTNIGLTIAGQSASFKNLNVWAAEANPTWEKTRPSLVGSANK